MKKTIFFLIGNRHILYKGKELPKDNLRNESLRLLDEYENEKQQITLQIVSPLIESFKDAIQEIILIVSDQGKSNYSQQDTLFIGEIVKRKIGELFGIRNISLKKFEASPVNLENIFPYMTNLIKQYEGDGTRKIICNSGGTPQMKQALLLLATNLLPPAEVEAYQVDEKSGVIKPINLSTTIRSELVKRSCLELIKNYEYAAAVKLVLENQFQTAQTIKLLALLNYGKYRLTFDFESANKNLDALADSRFSSIESDQLKKFRINIKTQYERIIELYQNLKIQWKKENYVDFLARLFNLEEDIFYLLIQNQFSIDLHSTKNHSAFSKMIGNDKALLGKLSSRKYNGKKINIALIGNPLLFFVLDVKPENRKITRQLNKIGNYISDGKNRSNGLDWLRNKSIAAHGFEPVSREIICQLYGQPVDNLFTDLEIILNEIRAGEPECCSLPTFDELNEEIKNILLNL